MTPVEWNYEITDKELSAIITVLMHWHHYLMGAEEDFKIWTDHQNLMYFRSPQKLN
jgi:RNase H-like domain found in reverse transcriptase